MNNKKLASLALAGLMSAGLVAGVANSAEHKAAATETAKEKHACKGLNSCKGQGADGKNECKGKGSCRTDGKTEGEK